MDEADVIVFVVSGKEGITDADEYVARMLYKTHKPIILAVNKVDNPEMRNEILISMRWAWAIHSQFSQSTGLVLEMFLTPSLKIFQMKKWQKILI